MKHSLAILALALFVSPAMGQDAQVLDENTRLMQAYMAQRAELVALRRAALDKVKAAKDDKERKQHRDKLAEDEKPLRAKVNEAARAYKAAEKAKRDQLEQAKPRG